MTNLFSLAATLPTPEARAVHYSGGSLRGSMAHASTLYRDGYIDDSHGPELALILAALSECLDVLPEWLAGLEGTLSAALSSDGVRGLNHVTQSPLPSFEEGEEGHARQYLARIERLAQVLATATENASRT